MNLLIWWSIQSHVLWLFIITIASLWFRAVKCQRSHLHWFHFVIWKTCFILKFISRRFTFYHSGLLYSVKFWILLFFVFFPAINSHHFIKQNKKMWTCEYKILCLLISIDITSQEGEFWFQQYCNAWENLIAWIENTQFSLSTIINKNNYLEEQ